MRFIHIIVICLGSALIVCAAFQIGRVRQYCSVVKQVQEANSRETSVLLRSLRQANINVTVVRPEGSRLPELDAVARLEGAWWLILGLGSGVVVLGALGLAWERRQPIGNEPLLASAAPRSVDRL